MSVDGKSYRQILRASSIIGGSAGLNYLIGMFRVKIVAALLGPTGVGLLGLYTSAISLVGTVSGLGIQSSAVREVARACGQDDADQAARTMRILRHACWVTGIFGWVLAAALSEPISIWLFGSTEQTRAIAMLGVTLLIGAVSGGEMALLQGMRRIRDIAWVNFLGPLLSTVVGITLYAWLGKDGILPVLVATPLINASLAYRFSRRIPVSPVDVSWTEKLQGTKHLLGLGIAFMWSAVLIAGLDTLTRSVVSNEFGLLGAGMYQAAWGLSGIFAGFILSAMGTDYYPCLTAVIHDRPQAIRLVNQQTEIGILLALPGLLGTLAFAPLIISFFYNRQFLQAADLLPWMVLGVFGRVLSWPMGFILLAKGASRWFAIVETVFAGVQVALLFLLVARHGLVGAAQAFAGAYAVYVLVMLWVMRTLMGSTWSSSVRRLVGISSACICAGMVVPLVFADQAAILMGGVVTLSGSIISLRGLAERLGPGSALTKWLSLVPGSRLILAKTKN